MSPGAGWKIAIVYHDEVEAVACVVDVDTDRMDVAS